MEEFMNRLETFLSWPDTALVSSSRLSECGFFYTGISDTVECYKCHTRLSNWRRRDDPLKRHIEASSECSVALGLREEDSKRDDRPNGEHKDNTNSSDMHSSAVFSNSIDTRAEEEPNDDTSLDYYKRAEVRTASFGNNWPPSCPVGIHDLVASGLYYVGPGDKVQCAWCKGRLYGWEPGDTAFGEHARHFPQCPFLIDTFGRATSNREPQRDNSHIPRGSLSDRKVEDNRQNSTAAKIAEDMGFHRDLIKQAMQMISSAASEVSTSQLLDVLFDLEEEKVLNNDASQNETETGNSLDNEVDELEELMADNLLLEQSEECVVCLENSIRMVFLPCRHLVCCQECGHALKHCPVCRALIVGTINAPARD